MRALRWAERLRLRVTPLDFLEIVRAVVLAGLVLPRLLRGVVRLSACIVFRAHTVHG